MNKWVNKVPNTDFFPFKDTDVLPKKKKHIKWKSETENHSGWQSSFVSRVNNSIDISRGKSPEKLT